MGEQADLLSDQIFRQQNPVFWGDGLDRISVSESMQEQEEIQEKIEAFAQIDEDVRNGQKPF